MSSYICSETGKPLAVDGAGPDGAKCAAGHFHPRAADGWGYVAARPAWEGQQLRLNGRGALDQAALVSAGDSTTRRVESPAERNSGPSSATGSNVITLPAIFPAGGSNGPAETLKLFATAREIAAETTAETPWLAKPYVARGAITELDGKPKASGKTTWLLALVGAVVDGRPFMGRPTVQTPVVLLTEQAGPSLRDALKRAGLRDCDGLVVMRWAASRGLSWPLAVEAAAAKADEIGAALLVVDTLSQFASLVGDSENDAGAALTAMTPLQVVAATGLGVIVARHERKAGGEVGESARGSSAYSGAVDIVLSLRKSQGQVRPTVRALQALSRFDETPDELLIELVNGEYRSLGTAQDVAAAEARREILGGLPETIDDAVSSKTLLESLAEQKVRRTTLVAVLDELLAAGTIGRTGGGKRGDPYRYFKPSGTDAAGAPVAPAESNDDGPLCANCGLVAVERDGLDCEHCEAGA